MGLETEYGLACLRADGTRSLEPEEAARALFDPVIAWGRSSNVFLPNASRLYVDVGSHPEYATAECDSPRQLAAHEAAGDRILSDLVARAQRRFDDDGRDARLHLFKNNQDSAGNSYGSHENYLIQRRGEFTRVPRILLPFLITRQILVGAGAILDGAFAFSGRSDHMWEAVSSATTRTRPIINTRDEPHGDAARYRRLHIIVGDSTLSEHSTLLRVGSTQLVLAVIEAGTTVPDLTLGRPLDAIRAIARDLTGTTPLDLENGRTTTAIAIQQTYHDLAAAHAERHDVPDADEVLALWQDGIDAVSGGDHGRVATRLDWAIKQELLTGVADAKGLALDSPQLSRLELAYHDLAPGAGLFPALRRTGRVAPLLDEAEIATAEHAPPATTRAAARGRFITTAMAAGHDVTCDWTTLKLPGQDVRPVTLMDPLDPDPAEAAPMWEHLGV